MWVAVGEDTTTSCQTLLNGGGQQLVTMCISSYTYSNHHSDCKNEEGQNLIDSINILTINSDTEQHISALFAVKCGGKNHPVNLNAQ